MIKTNKGFTLIELLVVIAIIGVLASVVLASLSSARTKGNDAKVQSQLAAVRAQAELYYSSQSPASYGSAIASGTACTGGMFGATAVNNGLASLLAFPSGYTPQCYTKESTGTASAWAIAVSNNTTFGSGTSYWCVDSSGNSKTSTTFTAPTNAVCA